MYEKITKCTDRSGYIQVMYSNGSVERFTDSCGYSSGSGEYGWQHYFCGYVNGNEPYFWVEQSRSEKCGQSSASKSTTAASTTSACRFSCSSYGYAEGQCVQGWKCANGCITYNSCVQ